MLNKGVAPSATPIVWISGPSGSGKTSLVDALLERHPTYKKVVTTTTRTPREGEKEGIDYFFLSRHAFHQLIIERKLLEWTYSYREYYGLTHEQLKQTQDNIELTLWIIDISGFMRLRGILKAASVFISTPSFESLQRRLIERSNSREDNIKNRLACAQWEVEYASNYDLILVNNKFEESCLALEKYCSQLLNQ